MVLPGWGLLLGVGGWGQDLQKREVQGAGGHLREGWITQEADLPNRSGQHAFGVGEGGGNAFLVQFGVWPKT